MPEPYYTHNASVVLDAPIQTVWASLRDIVKLAEMLIGSAAQNLMWNFGGSVERVPASFTFNLPGGPQIHEEVTGRSDVDHMIQYRAHGEVLGMSEYRAEIRLLAVTLPANKTFVTYTRTFSLAPGAGPSDLANLIAIMDNEAAALHKYFAQPPVGQSA